MSAPVSEQSTAFSGQSGQEDQRTDLQGLLGKVNVLDGEQARAERRHSPMPHDGGAGGGQDIRQEGERPRCHQHDVWVVLGVQQVDLQTLSVQSCSAGMIALLKIPGVGEDRCSAKNKCIRSLLAIEKGIHPVAI